MTEYRRNHHTAPLIDLALAFEELAYDEFDEHEVREDFERRALDCGPRLFEETSQ